ncbi:POSSIBLE TRANSCRIPTIONAL REGULATORY PROTEIN [Microbacterium esteraromaticum]|uniref:POSSIBLE TRANSCRIPTIONAL REGULATORY PROTEIN n=1 Tax=Microbacterium esteraromaticum TaxID=57043 RepID=A0A1R4J5G3_9MICO|nr:POSSIBLE TRANSCRIPTIONAL REGULATORY PROTEIN [Microbacterium esteraromaticum]
MDAVGRRTPRFALVGTAGSGKSAGLRHLYELLTQQSRTVCFADEVSGDLDDVAAADVLLVDDLHLFAQAQLAALIRRTDDPSASLIIARRPWPIGDEVRTIAHRLEQQVPTIVLGHVSRSDLLDHLLDREMRMPDSCVDHIVNASLGIAWLAAAAVQNHDSRDCTHDGTHAELDETLAELIIHRLDTVEEDLRRVVEEVCILPPGQPPATGDARTDEWVMQGYAQGLLLRNGETAPLVRKAVREAMPTRRIIDLYTRFPEALGVQESERPLRDSHIADALIANADQLLDSMPARASDLYDVAVECGADAETITIPRVRASWAAGHLDRAAALVDEALTTASGDARTTLTAVSAAMWSSRAMMGQAHQVYQLAPAQDDRSLTNATIAALGVGASAPPARPAAEQTLPSPLGVAMTLLRTGLEATIAPDCSESVLAVLVRAADMYSTAHDSGALCELPAVVAAVVALNLGRLATAESILEDAVARDHGGPWARRRLLLWSAWVAVQRAHPADAKELLERAASASAAPLPTRDALLMHAVRVALARRYDDASGLEAAWHSARSSVLRADIDLYLLHPLTELVSAASRSGDATRIEAPLVRALEIVESLGTPPIWAAHVRWAGIQQGILLSRPDRLAPHAKALVSAAAHNRVAAGMARAGRVWTDVLAGAADPDAIISAAEGLAEVGLMWDAARLAGHGAARATDRKVAAQLLACARELHPNDGTRRASTQAGGDSDDATQTSAQEMLSEREVEVARLVVQGKTYAEIGESIFISPRTAEHHIAHIRRRLGATTRSEMLARLRLMLGENGGSGGYPEGSP